MNRVEKNIQRYLDRHAIIAPQSSPLPVPDPRLRAVIVIPAYDELDDIGRVLDSLAAASEQPGIFEVIVVVNHSCDAPADVVERNIATLRLLEAYSSRVQTDRRESNNKISTSINFPIHALDRASPGRAYPTEIAGVGRARREGCDLALSRLASVGQASRGIIACLDGDSPASPGYIDQLLNEFDTTPHLLAGVCRYRHPVPDDPEHARAIMTYEAWMRLFELGLIVARTPYAFQTIGSCMILSAHGYAQADGMPTRQALNDFYMLEKILKTGGAGAVRQLANPLVYPSARLSTRVPRGTGPSVQMQVDGLSRRFELVEPPQAFLALGELIEAVRAGFSHPKRLKDAAKDPLLAQFLAELNAWSVFERLRQNATTAEQFERQFHTWFDNLKIVKFANLYRRANGGQNAFEAAHILLNALCMRDARFTPSLAKLPQISSDEATLGDWRQLLERLRDIELQIHNVAR